MCSIWKPHPPNARWKNYTKQTEMNILLSHVINSKLQTNALYNSRSFMPYFIAHNINSGQERLLKLYLSAMSKGKKCNDEDA